MSELIILREFTDTIQQAAGELVSSFASKLYSKSIIDSDIRNLVTSPSLLTSFQKAGKILQGVENKLKAERDDKRRAEVFDVFLKQMDDIIPLDSIAEQMRERYKQETAKAKAAKARAEKKRKPAEVDNVAEVADTQPDQKKIDEAAVTKALRALDRKLKDYQRKRYHFAVIILMDGNKAIIRDNKFLQLFTVVKNKLGSYPPAVSFTIDVLERSYWGDTDDLKQFAAAKFSLDDRVDLCLTAHDYYSIMTDDDFHSAKFIIPDIGDVDGLDRFDFVLLLFNRHYIRVGNVSKIEDEERYPHHFDEYKKRCKTPPATIDCNVAGATPPTAIPQLRMDTVPQSGANKTIPRNQPNRRIATDSPPADSPPADRLPADTDLPVIVHEPDDFAYDPNGMPPVYKMNTNPRGYCLILNMKKGREEGNKEDVDALKRLFTGLKFAVKEYTDLTRDEVMGENQLMEKVEKADHSQLSCFVMFILAHGGSHNGAAYFKTFDEQQINVSLIKNSIESTSSLIGKPKMLFLQSCRGSTLDTGYEVMDAPRDIKKIPRGSDFLVSFATIEDYAACRGGDGSRFIGSIVEIFSNEENIARYDVMSLMTIVTGKVADITRSVKDTNGKIVGVKQNPETTTTFRKFLYFGQPPY